MEDGIYFNLSEQEYFAEKRLSSSDIRLILESPTEYWFNSNYNPLKEEKTSEAMKDGKVFHAFILEHDKFNEKYKVMPPEIEALNKNTNQFKMWQALQSLPTISNKKFSEMSKIYDYLKTDNQLLDSNIFKNGFPEVSIFWEYSGIKCKSRIDYLKLQQLIDLKTFLKINRSNIDDYVSRYFYSYKVYIQMIFYLKAIEFARQFSIKQVHGDESQLDFFMQWRDNGNDMPLIVFVNRKLPQFRVKTFNKEQCPDLYRLGEEQIEKAIKIYTDFQEKKGMYSAWLEDIDLDNLSFKDENFPQQFMDMIEVRDE